MGYLTPVTTVERRPDEEDPWLYVRSFLIMRVAIGVLGLLLPLTLILEDWLLFGAGPVPRSSLSAYYYSGVRELFVGTLCATGVFLMAYKAAERSLDNTLSVIAGFAAIVVALFPTGMPKHVKVPTPLQDLLGEGVVEALHFSAAGVFIVSLGVITYYFGVREGKRDLEQGKCSPGFWRRYHWGCAWAIGASVLWIAVTEIAGGPRISLLIGEWAAVWAFAASWLMKGWERETLTGRPPSR